MYINKEYKIIYCHPPKTGGTSIVRLFNSIVPEDVLIYKGSGSCIKYTYHIPLDYIQLRVKKEAEIDTSSYTKVISIRNTYGRIFSHWKDYVVDSIKKHSSLKKILSFSNYIYNRFVDNIDPFCLECRSLLFYFPEDKSDINVIRYKNINEEVVELVKQVFGKTIKKIPHENSKKKLFKEKNMKRFLQREKNYDKLYGKDIIEYEDIYTDETRKIVADFFKKEINYFNYEF